MSLVDYISIEFNNEDEARGAEIVIENTATAAMQLRLINEYGLFRRESTIYYKMPNSIIQLALNHPDIQDREIFGIWERTHTRLAQAEYEYDSARTREEKQQVITNAKNDIEQLLQRI